MDEYKTNISELEDEGNLIAAAQQIKSALESNKNLTDEARMILADLGSQLSNISRAYDGKNEELGGSKEEGLNDIKNRLNAVQNKIFSWQKEELMIWDFGPEEANEYMNAVDEACKLTERLGSLSPSKDSQEDVLLQGAHSVLQTAKVRLQAEFKHMLVQNRQPFEHEHMSFRSNEEDDGSIISFGDESIDDAVQRDSPSRGSEAYIIELVHPDVIPVLKRIVSLMFGLNCGRECMEAFVSVQKDALDDCLVILGVEKSSMEDVLKMEWRKLNSRIKKWVRTMKIFVRVYLASEKWLIGLIFSEHESVSSLCFTESSKASIKQFLNFAEAIAFGPHQPEKLLRILDMYEVLDDLSPDIDVLYTDESGSCIRMKCQDTLRRLGDCAKATFLEFENAVANYTSPNPFPGGGIHHLTRYVMNYVNAITDYRDTLNVLLKDHVKPCLASSVPDTSPASDNDNIGDQISPAPVVALYFQSLISVLECNLDEKSKLYKDNSLRHLFLMNNIHYMAEKAKKSELRAVLGDTWIRKHNWKFQQQAMNYERATWSSILLLLKDEGLKNPGSNSISKTILKERLQSFYLAFEEVYRSQTGWLVPDSQLREDLRISTSLKVIQAYRTFIGRHNNNIGDRHIKYSADDLEDYLLHFFEGSQRSLHGYHRK